MTKQLRIIPLGSLGEIGKNMTILEYGRNSDGAWTQLSAADQRWVNTRYLRINGDISSLLITFTEVDEE